MDRFRALYIVAVLVPVYGITWVSTTPVGVLRTTQSKTRQPPDRQPPDIPTLEDLQSGVAVIDPSDHFKPRIRLVDGKISEQSKEQIESYMLQHAASEGGFEGDGMIQGQLAYNRLLQAIRENNEPLVNEMLDLAKAFMDEAGISLDNARKEAMDDIVSKTDNTGRRRKRFIKKQSSKHFWDKCIIPYTYDANLKDHSDVELAIKMFEENSGFRFIPWNSSVPHLYGLTHKNHLIFKKASGCFSRVGNQYMSEGQGISCCGGTTCLHEIGHAIGFIHEHKNPKRDDYLRINYNGIDKGYWSQYERTPTDEGVFYGPYDPTSIMHYWSGSFQINNELTFVTLDPDQEYLIGRDDRHFYFFNEVELANGCMDQFCPDSKPTCLNGGYATVVRGQCQCVCPLGLDSMTNCTTKTGLASTSTRSTWPAGQFALLKPVDGCPAGFKSGHMYHEPPNYIWGSNPYNAYPQWQWYSASHEFCVREDTSGGSNHGTWPKGSYCVYRKGGVCPDDFESGFIQMDDKPTNVASRLSGVLPDGEYGSNTRWEFCCRQDSEPTNPIDLPVSSPFILFPTGKCQEVNGMTVSTEFFNWRDDTRDSYARVEGMTPYRYKYHDTQYNLYFCYYSPSKVDCNSLHELTDVKPSVTITSPNYPEPYDKFVECINTILSPKGSRLKVDFSTFDVPCLTDDISVGTSRPGHPGASYCGDGFDKTLVTSENYVRIVLTSGGGTSGKGFSATVTILEDEDLCYTNGDKDRTYHGQVNYTKNFEPCVPWHEATNCRYHRFEPETFDDDLTNNYCRNTGTGTQPWCYTNKDTCTRDYCDACSIRKCYDLFTDCADLIEEFPEFCEDNLDGQALRGCRKSCGKCPVSPAIPVHSVQCERPSKVNGVGFAPVKLKYEVGEQVEYVCPSGGRRTSVCRSDGTWSEVGFVCGACPTGWGLVEDRCYKWFDIHKTRSEATLYCKTVVPESTLLVINSAQQAAHVSKIVDVSADESSPVWLGLIRSTITYDYTWEDGTVVSYTKWKKANSPGNAECFGTDDDGMWVGVSCTAQLSVVCQVPLAETRGCHDQISTCDENIRATPDLCTSYLDYAEANCPLSCGVCTPGASRKREIHGLYRRRRSVMNGCSDDWFTDVNLPTASTVGPTTSIVVEYTTANLTSTASAVDDETQSSTTQTADATVEHITTSNPGSESVATVTDATVSLFTSTGTTTADTKTTVMTTSDITDVSSVDDGSQPTTGQSDATTTTVTTTTTTGFTSVDSSITTTSGKESTESSPATTVIKTSTTIPTDPGINGGVTTTQVTQPTITKVQVPTATPTQPPVKSCSYPGLPVNAVNVGISTATINVGQFYEFSCDTGFALLTGDLQRACLKTGNLTGIEPVCADRSQVEEPVNTVDIRRRSNHGKGGYVYTTLNGDFTVMKSGNLTKWRFYSTSSGTIALQVWRPTSTEKNLEFIGENIFKNTKDDRIRTIEVNVDNQIPVQEGDLLAIRYPKYGKAGLPFTRCDLKYVPNKGNQLIIRNEVSALTTGQDYAFQQDSYTCKTWSLNAFIK